MRLLNAVKGVLRRNRQQIRSLTISGFVLRQVYALPLVILSALAQAADYSNSSSAELYLSHCASCHGPDGRGAVGIPNLTDAAWQYGGSPEDIERSIAYGRNSVMPALGMALGAGGDAKPLDQLVEYVLSLSSPLESDSGQLAAGESLFAMFCVSCHGQKGGGTAALGAPDLTDSVWLYGDTDTAGETIGNVVVNGRSNSMPGFGAILNAAELREMVTYIGSLPD